MTNYGDNEAFLRVVENGEFGAKPPAPGPLMPDLEEAGAAAPGAAPAAAVAADEGVEPEGDLRYLPGDVFRELSPEVREVFKQRADAVDGLKSELAEAKQMINQLTQHALQNNGQQAQEKPEGLAAYSDGDLRAWIESKEAQLNALVRDPENQELREQSAGLNVTHINAAREELNRRAIEQAKSELREDQQARDARSQIFDMARQDLAKTVGAAELLRDDSEVTTKAKSIVDDFAGRYGIDQNDANSMAALTVMATKMAAQEIRGGGQRAIPGSVLRSLELNGNQQRALSRGSERSTLLRQGRFDDAIEHDIANMLAHAGR